MARLSDVPVVLKRVGGRAFALRVWGEILDDHLLIYSGALAYAWLFAVFPFFIFLLNLVPYLPGDRPEQILGQMNLLLHASLPDEAADAIWNNMTRQIDSAMHGQHNAVLIVSLAVALWAASGGIGVTMAALDKCYEIDRPRAYYKRRPMAFALTFIVSMLAGAVILLLPLGTLVRAWVQHQEWPSVSVSLLFAFDVLRGAATVAIGLLILALLYHFGPCVKRRWRIITPGSVFSMVVWIVLGMILKTYMAHFGGKYGQMYGGLGGVAMLLLIFYVDALVLLIGAEINSEIEYEMLKVPRGSRKFRPAERGEILATHQRG